MGAELYSITGDFGHYDQCSKFQYLTFSMFAGGRFQSHFEDETESAEALSLK
jgi:hypothetical protein